MVRPKKSVLIIGGGKWQVPLVKKAKSLGYKVSCSNLFEQSPAFKFSDHYYVGDIKDINRQLEIAKEVNPDAIVTDQTDVAVMTCALLNEKLGLRGVSSSIAATFTNKHLMRTLLKHEWLNHPIFVMCSEWGHAVSFANQHGYPVVLKPINSQSSRGVSIARTSLELEHGFKMAMLESQGMPILCEEYIDGTEITVEGFKPPSCEHAVLAISRKTHFASLPMVASSLLYLQRFNLFPIAQIEAVERSIFSQLPFGITHVEFKVRGNKLYLIEAAVRGGGTKISSEIVSLISGYDTNAALLQCSLGDLCQPLPLQYNPQCSVALQFFECASGLLKAVHGLEQAKELPGVVDIEIEITPGQVVHPASDDRSRVGYFIAKAETDEALVKLISHVLTIVKFELAGDCDGRVR